MKMSADFGGVRGANKSFRSSLSQKACESPEASSLWSRSAERENPYVVRSARGELKNSSVSCFERGDAL